MSDLLLNLIVRRRLENDLRNSLKHVLATLSRISSKVSHSIGLGHHFQWSIIQVCHQIPFMLAHDFEDGHQSILDPGLVPEIKGVTR